MLSDQGPGLTFSLMAEELIAGKLTREIEFGEKHRNKILTREETAAGVQSGPGGDSITLAMRFDLPARRARTVPRAAQNNWADD